MHLLLSQPGNSTKEDFKNLYQNEQDLFIAHRKQISWTEDETRFVCRFENLIGFHHIPQVYCRKASIKRHIFLREEYRNGLLYQRTNYNLANALKTHDAMCAQKQSIHRFIL